MSLSFLATGFEHINKGGVQKLFGAGAGARYNHFDQAQLGDMSFDAIMSSIEVTGSTTAKANAILFSNAIGSGLYSIPIGNFAGEFRQIVVEKNGPTAFHNLTDTTFNDRTRSILLVNTNRGPEFRVSFRDKFLDTWKSTLDGQLGSQASRKGDPLMTWEAFPQGISYLASDQIYLKIHQNLNINIDWWPDYDASITYHLYLYLDSAGKLHGYCQRWSAWVEGGIKSNDIFNALWPKVISGASTINDALSSSLSSLPAFKDFYYLPGRQTSGWSGVNSANTWDDVTLVFQF